MHYQWSDPMGKLVFCPYGSIMDVIVDIREGSYDLGKVYYYNLSAEAGNSLWVPPGFAHGFQVLSDEAVVTYKCSAYYNKDGESGINPFDDSLNIAWNVKECPVKGIAKSIVSEKDIAAKSFNEYCKDFKF
jgi:dTDP-4-dehydrorhamnose 3,5-epimerase